MSKPRNRHGDFEAHVTKPVGFEPQTGKPKVTGFEANLGETVDLDFEAKTRNLCSSSPWAWYRPHTTSYEISIVWPPSTQPVLDHH
jgi:hypothetical protein